MKRDGRRNLCAYSLKQRFCSTRTEENVGIGKGAGGGGNGAREKDRKTEGEKEGTRDELTDGEKYRERKGRKGSRDIEERQRATVQNAK